MVRSVAFDAMPDGEVEEKKKDRARLRIPPPVAVAVEARWECVEAEKG